MDFLDHPSPIPAIDRRYCTDCGLCAEVCPSETLVIHEGRVHVAPGVFTGCIACGQCMMVCPGGGIRVPAPHIRPDDLLDLPRPIATVDQFDALLLARRSIRTFATREVERVTIDRIVAMAATAPVGIPPSEVGILILLGREKVRQFVADVITSLRRMRQILHPALLLLARPFMTKARYKMLRGFVSPLMDMLVQRWDTGEDALFHDAPAALVFHRGPTSDPADAHIATTYAMLAAHALGLGSCLVGTLVALDHERGVKEKYAIPIVNSMGLGLILGYPKVRFHRNIRRPFASVRFA